MGNLVEIAHFYDPEEVYCARGYLRSHGIDVILQNEHHLTVAPFLRVALGGYRLLAMSEIEDDAVRILNMISGAASDESAAKPSQQRDTGDLRDGRSRDWLWLPIAFLSGVPFIPVRKSGWIEFLRLAVLISLYATFLISWGYWLGFWLS